MFANCIIRKLWTHPSDTWRHHCLRQPARGCWTVWRWTRAAAERRWPARSSVLCAACRSRNSPHPARRLDRSPASWPGLAPRSPPARTFSRTATFWPKSPRTWSNDGFRANVKCVINYFVERIRRLNSVFFWLGVSSATFGVSKRSRTQFCCSKLFMCMYSTPTCRQ